MPAVRPSLPIPRMTITRRDLLRHAAAGTALLAGTASVATAFPPVGRGAGPTLRPPRPSNAPPLAAEPDVYAFQLGGADAYVIHDGVFTVPGVQSIIAPEAPAAEVAQLLQDAYLPTDHVALSLNVLLVKTPGGPVLIDAGGGTALGPTAGRLLRGLARVGVAPGDVAGVVITHAHGDHVAGLLGADGAPAFPSARVFVAADEAAFWESDRQDWTGSRVPPDGRTQATATARKFLSGVGSRLQRVAAGGTLLPGLAYVATPGHTPGHQAVRISFGGESLLHVGDAVHQYAIQFPRPDWTMAFDTRPAQAVATRRALFAEAAAGRTRIMGYHLPFPGLGHVRAAGRGYAWVPQPWVA